MTKKDEKPPVLLIDDEDDPGASSVKPGILYSSMTELRGFKLGPSGTSLGLGRPGSRAEESDSESSPPVKTDPEE